MNEKKSQSKFGCFFTGCLGAAAALVLVAVVVLVGSYYFVGKYLDEYTDTKPNQAVLYKPQLSVEEGTQLKSKWETFRTKSSLDLPVEPLELDSDQLNHLINSDPEFSELKNKVRVTIKNNIVNTDISIPSSMVKEIFPDIPNVNLIQNRYFNANATVDLRVERNQLAVYLQSIRVKNKPLPDQYLSKLKGVDLLKDARFAGQIKRQFSNLRNLTVKDGKIVMIGRSGTLQEMLNKR